MSDHITVIGNIATEPERRQTSTGVPVISFRLASSQRRFDARSGQWVDGATNWYTVSAFRRLAEHALVSLHKGQRIVVTGSLKLREWETSTKKGLEAEIDADGIGHDLLWGTSTFQRDTSGIVGESPRSEPTSLDAARHDATDPFRVPIGEGGADAFPSAIPQRSTATVGAGLVDDDAWDARPLGSEEPVEVPF
ncbi:single-stranded DNA-binding protein [Microbacterium sp.]|uniref:single-stranded DNA-binding protein n=1 Tax=Microbacterium sp. TaxID=51671 RepID=UPI0039E2C785